MVSSMERGLSCLTDHFVAVCLFLALFILTWIGVGDVRTVSMLGLLLCAVGVSQPSARVDRKVFFLLILYNLVSMISSYAVYGNVIDGYASTQWLFPVIYLLTATVDDREGMLVRRLCAVWTVVAAAGGIGQFAVRAVMEGSARRTGGFLGNPNAMGIFLTVGWFGLNHCLQEQKERREGRPNLRPAMEPILLIGLTLTLSMGSFAAMAAGILTVLAERGRRAGGKEMFRLASRILAKASLAVGTGLLIYLAAARTRIPWLCLTLIFYGLALAACWEKFEEFLEAYPGMAVLISGFGLAVAVTAAAVRPSSVATFAERLEMMRNGLGYLTKNPVLGIGPYQWRFLNLYDGDKYFNTWHIHNVVIHVGVEMGWIAMAAVVMMGIRLFRKQVGIWAKAGLAAFFLHNMMDTGFFYMAVLTLVFMTLEDPRRGGKQTGPIGLKVMFGIFALMFGLNLYCLISLG